MKTRLQKFILVIFISIILIPFANAKDAPMKFGKISDLEWEITETELDSSASAVELCEYGIMYMGFDYAVRVIVHKRLKILKEEGIDYANISIPFYKKDRIENITRIKAQTYNKAGGKVEKYKVERKQIFEADLNERYSEKRFTFPNVKVGSIIEYSYELSSSDFLHPTEWYFQSDIPTLRSEFTANINERLDVRVFFKGNQLPYKYGNRSSNFWTLRNIQPLKDEPFNPCARDYIEMISFQLAGYRSGSGYQNVMKNWDGFTDDLLSNSWYKSYLGKKSSLESESEEILGNESLSDLEKIEKLYSHTVKNMVWNGKYGLFPEDFYSEFRKSGQSNGTGLNLYFVTLLRSAGIKAYPAMLSTKKHGKNWDVYPLATLYNHVITYIPLENKPLLIDAAGYLRAYDLLSPEALNEKVFVLNEKNPHWHDIGTTKSSQKNINCELRIEGDRARYKIRQLNYEYAAYDARRKLQKTKSDEEILHSLVCKKGFASLLDSITVQNIDDVQMPLVIDAGYSSSDGLMMTDSMLYINPFQFAGFMPGFDLDEQPFKYPERNLPLEFYYPRRANYKINIVVPENYVLEEMPKVFKGEINDKGGHIIYVARSNGPNVELEVNISLGKSSYSPAHYTHLQELFSDLVKKLKEPVILKTRGI